MEPDMHDYENPELQHQEPVLNPNAPKPVVINPFHFTLLWLATLGIYAIWWQYKCWKYFKETEGEDTLPGVRAILFLLFGIELLEKIKLYCLEYESEVSYSPIAVWASVIGVNIIAHIRGPFRWLSILGFIPFLFPVRELNFYFTANKNGYVNHKLNDRQILLLVLGAMLWLMIIASIYMGVDPNSADL